MNEALYKLWLWFWHLLPANPILVRVVYGASKRPRHLWLRAGYLVILLAVVGFAQMQLSGGQTLADLAKGASQTFIYAAYAQLALMCVLAPIFTAGAITQEKDSRTYNILLTTPLSNAQIVLGSLISRLFFVIMLLVAGLPIFFATMIYGGITSRQILQNLALSGATAIITGSLAISISMIRVGTRRTIFSFYVMIFLYLIGVYFLARQSFTSVPEAAGVDPNRPTLSWLAPYHPFLCLEVVLNRVQAPDIGLVAAYGPIEKYMLAYPHVAYVLMTLITSVVLVIVSMFFVRKSDKEGETDLWVKLKALVTRQDPGERRRRLRHVWSNPVAWREAATRASAMSRGLMRWIIIGGGSVAAIWLLYQYIGSGPNGAYPVAVARQWLAGFVMIEFGLVLLVATNTAATAITKEREANTMDLLTTTPLTSAYIVFGKLRGLVSFVAPLIVVPTASVLLFALADLVRRTKTPIVPIESALELALLMLTFSAVGCIIGMKASLNQKKTVQAVMVSIGTLVILCLITTAAGMAMLSSAGAFGAALAPATPFTSIWFNIDPSQLFEGDQTRLTPDTLAGIRMAAAIGTIISVLVFFGFARGFYGGMVKNYDMIIRKQSAQL